MRDRKKERERERERAQKKRGKILNIMEERSEPKTSREKEKR